MAQIVRSSIAIVAVVLALFVTNQSVAQGKPWPQRILITNDNGINDTATQALARAFGNIADVVLVASSENRSGTSNLTSFTKTGKFIVERRNIGDGVRAWALDGFPADCVFFAIMGPMADTPPDLVVSGINGGINASDEWFFSGTIGAARTAAFLGIPSIAVSGVNDDDPDAIAAVVDWVLRLARSEIMKQAEPPNYLTVSLPIGPPSAITGVEVVDRARGIVGGVAQIDSVATQDTKGKEIWSFQMVSRGQPGADSDVSAIARGHIAVVPMLVGDTNPTLLEWLRTNDNLLPAWAPVSMDR